MRITRTEFVRLIKFSIVGLSNTLLSIITIYVLMKLGVDFRVANLIGYIIGLTNSFIWNKLWVFKSKGNKVIKEILLFFMVFVICYLSQYIILTFTALKMNVNKYISQIIAMIFYTLLNYYLNKLLTFRVNNLSEK